MAGTNIDNMQLAELQKIANSMQKLVGLLGRSNGRSDDNRVRASAHSQRGQQERAAAGGAVIPRSLTAQLTKLETATRNVTDKFEQLARAQSAYLNAVTTGNRQMERSFRDLDRRQSSGGSGGGNNNNRNRGSDHDDYPGDRRRPRRPRLPTARTPRSALVHGVGAHLRSSMVGHVRGLVQRSPLAGLATLGESFALLTKGAQALIAEFHALRQTGFRSKIWELNKDSLSLGMSVKALAEMMSSSKAQMNTIGLKNFVNFIEGAQSSIMSLGMNTEEANKFIASSITNASSAGMNMLDTMDMSKVVESDKKAFEAMRATTNITSEEFTKMTKTLLENNSAQSMMLGMSKQQKLQFYEGMNLERQRLSQMQLTVDQQAKILNTMMEIAGMKLKDRFETAAKFAGAASVIGMDPAKAARAQQLVQKKNRSADETKELRELMTEYKEKKENMRMSGAVGENLVDSLDESLGPFNKNIDDMTAVIQSKQAGNTLSDKSMTDKISESIDGPITVALSKAYGQMESLLGNPMTKIVAGIAGVGLAVVQLMNISRAVRAIERNTAHPSGLSRQDVRDRRMGRLRQQRGGVLRQAGRGLAGGVRDVSRLARGKIGLGALGRVGGVVAGGSILGSVLSSVDDMMTDAKEISMKSDVTGGLMSAGMAALGGPWTLGITAVTKGLTDGYKGWQKAGEFFSTEAPTMGQKIASAAGGFLHGVTFGMLDGEKASKFLYDAGSWIGDAFSKGWDITKKIGGFIADGFDWLTGLPKTVFGYFIDWYASVAKTATKVLGFFGATDLQKKIDGGIDAARNYLVGTPKDNTSAAVQQPTIAQEVPKQQRQIAQPAPINTATDNDTQATDTGDNATPKAQDATQTADSAKTSDTISQQNDITMADVFNKLAELVELQKADTSISKEQLSAVKDLGPSKFGLSPSSFVRT